MTQLLDRLVLDHRHLLRLLDLFDDLLDRFGSGGEADYEMMIEMLEYMDGYADQVHHPNEEIIFDRLRERSDEALPVLDKMTEQHAILPEMNKRFRRSLDGIVQGEVLLRDEVMARGRELIETLREHLDLEDTEVFPICRERLTASDWDELLATAPGVEDPLFDSTDQARFRVLLQCLQERESS